MIHQSTRGPVQATLKERRERECKTKDTQQKNQDDCTNTDRKTLKNYRVARTENGKRTMIKPLIKNMTTKREKTDQTGTKCEINVNTIVNKHDQTQHMHQD